MGKWFFATNRTLQEKDVNRWWKKKKKKSYRRSILCQPGVNAWSVEGMLTRKHTIITLMIKHIQTNRAFVVQRGVALPRKIPLQIGGCRVAGWYQRGCESYHRPAQCKQNQGTDGDQDIKPIHAWPVMYQIRRMTMRSTIFIKGFFSYHGTLSSCSSNTSVGCCWASVW